MLSYAIRRMLGAIPTLFIIITIAFFMMRLAPGGPFDGARRLPPEIERNIAAAYDLDKPLYEQYFIYLGKLAAGRFRAFVQDPRFHRLRTDHAGLPGQPAARRARHDARHGRGNDARRDRGAETEPADRLFGDVDRDDRHLHPLVRHRAAAAARVRDLRHQSVRARSVAARRRLEQRRRCEHGAARDRAVARADRRDRAPDARQHGRGAALQLHPHRARERLADLSHHHAPRAACGIAAAGELSRPGDRRHHQRLADRRADLRPARDRPLFRARRRSTATTRW